MPVNPRSTQQGIVRARLSANAAGWRALTDAQRAGWKDLGQAMSRTDSLGQTHTLTGFQAYVSVNNNNVTVGNAIVSDAPALVTPTALLTVTITLTSVAFSLAYTPTPMAAGERILTFASSQQSAGRSFSANMRLLQVSAAAAASPINALAAYTAKWGVPVTGNRIFVTLFTYITGFKSGPFFTSAVVA